MKRLSRLVAPTASVALYALPFIALAQFGRVNDFIGAIIVFINNTLVPLVFAIAFLVFIWGVFRYFIFDTESDREKGKSLMLYGILGFVIMVSVWGLVNAISGGFGFTDENLQNIPNAPIGNP